MLLNELFDKPLPWRTKWDEFSEKVAVFELDGEQYRVRITRLQTNFKFSLIGTDEVEVFKNVWQMGFARGDSDAKTGTGNEIKVFSTVIDIFKHWLDEYPGIGQLIFSAKDADGPGRAKLYHRFAKVLEKNGWTYMDTEEFNTRKKTVTKKDYVNDDFFFLYRQEPDIERNEDLFQPDLSGAFR